jgi:hypothetical protein
VESMRRPRDSSSPLTRDRVVETHARADSRPPCPPFLVCIANLASPGKMRALVNAQGHHGKSWPRVDASTRWAWRT